MMFTLETLEESEDAFSRDVVQIACGLVGEQQFRFRYQCSCDGDSLLFTAGKFSGTIVSPAFQSNLLQPSSSPRERLSMGHPLHKQRHGDVFQGGELGQKIMKLPDESDLPISEIRSGAPG